MIRFYASGYAARGAVGIRECAFDPQTAECTVVAECASLENPSYVLAHPRRPVLYAVEELSPEGRIAALATDGGGLRKLCALPSGGADPCHLSLSPDARFLFVSNYSSGSIAVFRLDGNGVPVEMSDFAQHEMDAARRGMGNPSRQEGPHVHFSHCDGTRVFVSDLGLDAVFVYGWDAARGKLIDRNECIQLPVGSGPRHFVFSADSRFLYVLCELNARIYVFTRDAGDSWRQIQDVATVPEDFRDFSGFNYSAAAAIRLVDDRTLCASNRGHDSIAVFQIAPDGKLGGRRLFSAEGRTPRDFQVFGDYLVVANQGSGNIAVFARNGANDYSLRGQMRDVGNPSSIGTLG